MLLLAVLLLSPFGYVAVNVRVPLFASNLHAATVNGNIHVNYIFSSSMFNFTGGSVTRVPEHPVSREWLSSAGPLLDANIGADSNMEVILPLWITVFTLGALSAALWAAWHLGSRAAVDSGKPTA